MEAGERQIRAVYTKDTVRVYQAYGRNIAEEAVKKGTFGENFKMGRMTWIKPSFLWMMYRCGWATKENQEYVLAIELEREAFDYIVENAVPSSYSEILGISRSQWEEQVKNYALRCQWDPERDIFGNPLNYRSIQLGLRGDAVRKYVDGWIRGISDITGYVKELDGKRKMGIDINGLLPQEKIYPTS